MKISTRHIRCYIQRRHTLEIEWHVKILATNVKWFWETGTTHENNNSNSIRRNNKSGKSNRIKSNKSAEKILKINQFDGDDDGFACYFVRKWFSRLCECESMVRAVCSVFAVAAAKERRKTYISKLCHIHLIEWQTVTHLLNNVMLVAKSILHISCCSWWFCWAKMRMEFVCERAQTNDWVKVVLFVFFHCCLSSMKLTKLPLLFLSVSTVFSHSFNLNCSYLNIFFIPSFLIHGTSIVLIRVAFLPQFEFSVWTILTHVWIVYHTNMVNMRVDWMRCGNRQNKKNLVNFAFHFVSHETFRQVNLLKTHVIWLPKLSIFTYSISIWHHAFYSPKSHFSLSFVCFAGMACVCMCFYIVARISKWCSLFSSHRWE